MAEKDLSNEPDKDEDLPEIRLSPRDPLPLPPEIHYTRPTLGQVKPDDNTSQVAGHGAGMAAGAVFVSGIIGGALLGSWIDARWNHSQMPWATLIMTLIGAAAGFLNLKRLLARTNRNQK